MPDVKLTDLILDYDVYPRNDISSSHVTMLCDAIELLDPVPPIVVDKQSRRVVDGFHRYRAYERLGKERIGVVWRDYKSEAELFADAVRLNGAHGRAFDSFDRRRAVERLQRYGFKPREIEAIVRIPRARIDQFTSGFAKSGSGASVVIKQGLIAELKGRRLTKSQERTNEKWSGRQPAFHVNQLISLLEAGIVPTSAAFSEGMDHLCDLWRVARKKSA